MHINVTLGADRPTIAIVFKKSNLDGCADRKKTVMTRHNIPLGRILGIPIGLDYSWFVIFALLTWMLATS
jgi:hypothetical protein